MKKLVVVLAVLVTVVVLFVSIGPNGFDLNRLLNPGLYAKFGNFGGLGRKPGDPEPFDPKAIKFGIRWFPTYVSIGPDNDTLLVSLCHVSRDDFCRIGKYSLSQDKWDIYSFEEDRTYQYPQFSPDGQWIYYQSKGQLYRRRPDGTHEALVADVPVINPSFSSDGKRLIYWGVEIVNGKRTASIDLFMLDIESGKQTWLTDHVYADWKGRPFLTPDGEHFVFNASLTLAWSGRTSCAQRSTDSAKASPKDSGGLFGDRRPKGVSRDI